MYDGDGIVELEFLSEKAMADASSSEAVQRLLPEDELQFLRSITLAKVPAGARQIWPGMVKVMMATRLVNEADWSVERLVDVLNMTGCVACSVDPVIETMHRSGLLYETLPPHFYATLWFDSSLELDKAFGKKSRLAAFAESFERGAAWLCNPLAIIEQPLEL